MRKKRKQPWMNPSFITRTTAWIDRHLLRWGKPGVTGKSWDLRVKCVVLKYHTVHAHLSPSNGRLKTRAWMKKTCPDLDIPVMNYPRISDKLKAESKISKSVISCGDFCKKVSWIRPQQSISLLQERPMCFPSIDKHLLIGYSVCVRTHLFLGLISLLSLPPRLTTLWVHFLQGPALIQCSEFTIGQT